MHFYAIYIAINKFDLNNYSYLIDKNNICLKTKDVTFALYAFTANKKLKNQFMEIRNKQMFTVKKISMSEEEYMHYKTDNVLYELVVVKDVFKKKIISNLFEMTIISNLTEYKDSLDIIYCKEDTFTPKELKKIFKSIYHNSDDKRYNWIKYFFPTLDIFNLYEIIRKETL